MSAQDVTCPSCGGVHPLEEIEGSFFAPDAARRSFLSRLLGVRNDGNYCVLDRRRYFVRGILLFPVEGRDSGYGWGMWAEVDRETYRQLQGRRDAEGRENDPPRRGALANELPLFGRPLLGVEVSIRPMQRGLAPELHVFDATHPVAREQAQGISLARVMAFNHFVLGVENR